MPTPFTTRRRVEFCETDAAGIAHFSAFFQFMEQAEHALLREVGLSVVMPDEEMGGVISWPRVNASCEFTGAVKFEDVLDIAVTIERIGERSVSYDFRFTLDARPVAEGKMRTVCCHIQPGAPPRSIPIPEPMRSRLARFA